MNKIYSSSGRCRDVCNPSIRSDLVKDMVLHYKRRNPNMNCTSTKADFSYQYGLFLCYCFVHWGKKLAIKDIHGDDLLPYHIQCSYVLKLGQTKLGSHVIR